MKTRLEIFFAAFILVISVLNIIVWCKTGVFSALTSNNLAFGTYYENEGIFDSLFSNAGKTHGGGYTALFLSKFFSAGLSKIFNIHIADFIGYYLGFIKGVFFCLMLLLLVKSSLLYKKSKLLFSFLYLFLSVSSFSFFFSMRAEMMLNDNTNFFRFIFPMIFYFLFWGIISKTLINAEADKIILKKKYIIFICFISCIFISVNAENIASQSILMMLFIILYNFCIKFYSGKASKAAFSKKSLSLHPGKIFYAALFFICLLFYLFLAAPGTKELLNDRIGIKSSIFEFLNHWITGCFLNHLPYHILFAAALPAAFCIAVSRHEIKKAVLPVLIYLSSLAGMFLLIFAEKEGIVYVIDSRIGYIYRLILLYSLFMTVSYVFKYSARSYLYIKGAAAAVILAAVIQLSNLEAHSEEYKKIMEQYYTEKLQSYIQEKMFRFYAVKGMTPYLDKKNIDLNTETCLLWMPVSNEIECSEISPHIYNFYKFVYKKQPASDKVCFIDNAAEKFYKAGGYFTKEEINSIKFSSLRDDNFIINAEGIILPSREIQQIMEKTVRK